jgi:hypothetical protein
VLFPPPQRSRSVKLNALKISRVPDVTQYFLQLRHLNSPFGDLSQLIARCPLLVLDFPLADTPAFLALAVSTVQTFRGAARELALLAASMV